MEWNEIIEEVWLVAGGASVIVTGLAAVLGKIWVGRTLKKLQAQLDATNKYLQAELEKGLLVHKVQFEKEFKIYEELWSKLVELKKAALSLRPELDMVDPRVPEEERKIKRLTKFGDAIADFIDITDKNRPFYSDEVFCSMEKLWKLAHSEAIQYKHQDPYADSYWDKAQKNRDEILSEIDSCCEQIRERIGSVRVSE